MIRRIVDFALNNRLLVLALALLLFAGGIVSGARVKSAGFNPVKWASRARKRSA